MAKVIFDRKISDIGLADKCISSTAGLQRASQDNSPFMDIALRRSGYAALGEHRPTQLRRAMVQESDIVLVASKQLNDSLARAWNGSPELTAKLNVLPHYGLPSEKRNDDIFDPRYALVSPQDDHSSADPLSKRIARNMVRLLGNRFGELLVDRFTPYVPFTSSSEYREKIISLYQRTIYELEPCIDGAIVRMRKEGYL